MVCTKKWRVNATKEQKKVLTNVRTFCGAYETRTRDLLRDRQAF